MKLESLKMNLKSLKKQANNAKCWSIKGKSAKILMTFRKNKPNFVNFEIAISSFEIGKYEILTDWRGKKQTQYKANTNPIAEMPKMNINIYHTKEYSNEMFFLTPKTKPIQTQSKPNWSKAQVLPALSLCPRYIVEGSLPKDHRNPEFCLAIYIEKGCDTMYHITLKFENAVYKTKLKNHRFQNQSRR